MMTSISLTDPRLTKSELHLLRIIAMRLGGGAYLTKDMPAAWRTPSPAEDDNHDTSDARGSSTGKGGSNPSKS
jgi:hypothetical protein